jgi:hypothetical protein
MSFPLFGDSNGEQICLATYTSKGDIKFILYVGDKEYYGISKTQLDAFLQQHSQKLSPPATSFETEDEGTVHNFLSNLSGRSGNYPKIKKSASFLYSPTTYNIGAGLKHSKSKKKVVAKHTGLKPIKLGTGLPSYPVDNLKAVEPKKTIKIEKPDPYKLYNEELGLHPIKMEKKVKEEKPKKEKKHKVAEGIDGGEPSERYIALGKFAINMRQLKKGVLQVVYKSLAVNPTFNPRPISNEFHNYLHELLTNKHSIQSLYKLMPDEEKELFERLTINAGVFDKLGIPKIGILDKDKNEMERFKLLHGEFLAGNDNTSMIRELRNLILKFLSENRISKNKAYEYLLELNG